MAKTSETKTTFQEVRDELGLSRLEAANLISEVDNGKYGYLDENKLVKIEHGTVKVQPDDVVALSKAYNRPELRNYYCCHQCSIGKLDAPEVDDANNVHMITVDKLYANEPINKNRLQDKNGDDVALSLKLPQGKVAYSFDAASVKSVDGYISEGDTVDVLVNKKDDSGNIKTEIAYKDLKILRVSTNAENSTASQSGTKITKYSTLTVEVTKKQALKLYEIENEYDYKLILNPRR